MVDDLSHIHLCHAHSKSDLVKAENAYLYDSQDRRYIDYVSGLWCASLGHCNPEITAIIHDQIDRVQHLGKFFTPHLADEAAERVLEHLHFEGGKAIFLSSGSEAVELATTIAKLVTGRSKLAAFSNTYLSAYGQAKSIEYVVDIDRCSRCPQEECSYDCSNLEHIDFEQLAAFMFEPGSFSGTVRFPPEKVVRFIEKAVHDAGALFIVDEVTTGLGRTGKWFGFEHYGLRPDIVALGKSLGNGYPVSAVVFSQQISAKLTEQDFYYCQSHQNDPLGCAVAAGVVEYIEAMNLVTRANKLGTEFIERLRQRLKPYPFVVEIRGRGMMVGIEIEPEPDIPALSVEAVYDAMLDKGYIIGITPKFNTIRLLPPLTIARADLFALADALEGYFGALTE